MSTYVIKNAAGEIEMWGAQPFPGSVEVDFEVVRGYDGKLYKSGEEPAEPELVIDYKTEALTALEKTDLVALRYFKAGIPFPEEWAEYCVALRTIINTGEGPLPEEPEKPEGI